MSLTVSLLFLGKVELDNYETCCTVKGFSGNEEEGYKDEVSLFVDMDDPIHMGRLASQLQEAAGQLRDLARTKGDSTLTEPSDLVPVPVPDVYIYDDDKIPF